jgi:hypothetical protein
MRKYIPNKLWTTGRMRPTPRLHVVPLTYNRVVPRVRQIGTNNAGPVSRFHGICLMLWFQQFGFQAMSSLSGRSVVTKTG